MLVVGGPGWFIGFALDLYLQTGFDTGKRIVSYGR